MARKTQRAQLEAGVAAPVKRAGARVKRGQQGTGLSALSKAQQRAHFTVVCPFCAKRFRTEANLKKHAPKHVPEKLVVPCRECPMRFAHKGGLACHMRTHAAEKRRAASKVNQQPNRVISSKRSRRINTKVQAQGVAAANQGLPPVCEQQVEGQSHIDNEQQQQSVPAEGISAQQSQEVAEKQQGQITHFGDVYGQHDESWLLNQERITEEQQRQPMHLEGRYHESQLLYPDIEEQFRSQKVIDFLDY